MPKLVATTWILNSQKLISNLVLSRYFNNAELFVTQAEVEYLRNSAFHFPRNKTFHCLSTTQRTNTQNFLPKTFPQTRTLNPIKHWKVDTSTSDNNTALVRSNKNMRVNRSWKLQVVKNDKTLIWTHSSAIKRTLNSESPFIKTFQSHNNWAKSLKAYKNDPMKTHSQRLAKRVKINATILVIQVSKIVTRLYLMMWRVASLATGNDQVKTA